MSDKLKYIMNQRVDLIKQIRSLDAEKAVITKKIKSMNDSLIALDNALVNGDAE